MKSCTCGPNRKCPSHKIDAANATAVVRSGLNEAPVTDRPYRLMWGDYYQNQLVHHVYYKHFASWKDAMEEGNRLLSQSTWHDCEFTIIKIVSRTVVAGEGA